MQAVVLGFVGAMQRGSLWSCKTEYNKTVTVYSYVSINADDVVELGTDSRGDHFVKWLSSFKENVFCWKEDGF